MAFRINTVEYAWETNQASASGSVTYTAPTKLVTIPETGSRTFLSVDIEMYMRDANTGQTISSITAYGLSCSIDGNMAGDAAVTQTIPNTSDNTSLLFKQTFTDHFNTRFTGSSHIISPSFCLPQTNSGRWTGHSFRLLATYQYSDTNADTLIKTVALPLDAIYGTLPTTQTVFGKSDGGYTNIPALDAFLPESTKQYKDIWIEYVGFDNGGVIGTTGPVRIFTQIDSGSENPRGIVSSSMFADIYYFDAENISGTLDTSTTHTLKSRADSGSRMSWISPTVYVTYTYRHDLTTSVINSLRLPANYEFYNCTNTFLADYYGQVNFLVPETRPSLEHSALVLFHPSTGSVGNRTVRIGNTRMSVNSYDRPNPAIGSAIPCNYRFDSGASTSSLFALSQGYNSIPFGVNSVPRASNGYRYNGYFLINYTASILPNGIYGHQKTLYFGTGSFSGLASVTRTNINLSPSQSINPDITSSYYTNGVLHENQFNVQTGNTYVAPAWYCVNYTMSADISASFNVSISTPRTPELGLHRICTIMGKYIAYPNQPIILSDNDQYKINYFNSAPAFYVGQSGNSKPHWFAAYMNYSQNIIRVTGSLSSCNFTSTDYAVDIYLSGSNVPISPIYNLTSSGSGTSKTFMFDWYENINKLYAVTKYPEIGISNLATASNGNILTIDYGTSSGGEKSFTFIG